MTIALSIACAVLLALLLRERRVARRRHGALICEHRQALSRAYYRGYFAGLMWTARQKRMGRDWQEATILSGGVESNGQHLPVSPLQTGMRLTGDGPAAQTFVEAQP